MDIRGLLQDPLMLQGLGLLINHGRPEGLLQGSQMAESAMRRQMQQKEYEIELKKQQAQQEAQRRIAESMAMQQVPQSQMAQGGLPTIGAQQGPAYNMDQQRLGMLNDIATAQPELFSQMAQQQFLPQSPEQTDLARKLQEAGYQPGTPEFQQAMQRYLFKPVGTTVNIDNAPKLPGGYQWVDPGNPSAGVQPIKGGDKEKGTQGQNVAANYANRMAQSENRMDEIVSKGYQPGSLKDYMAQSVPLGNYAMSPEAQTYRQAQEDWVRAKLRKESGAVIADEEMAREIRTYFPQPGDTPEVIEEKKKARKIATDSVIAETEGQYERKFGKRNNEMSLDERMKKYGF